jgi:hypothetical protein
MMHLPENSRAEWRASPALQAEFDNAEAYVAYQQAINSGAATCIGGQTINGAALGFKPVSMLDRG